MEQPLAYELNLARRGSRARPPTRWPPRTRRGRASSPALGPTNRTASISPDVNDPGFRNVTFDELRETPTPRPPRPGRRRRRPLLVETVFDTLNAKAALFAIDRAVRRARALGCR
jgi:5-methyltetrahydrofolate--homocysteine methyltransferase